VQRRGKHKAVVQKEPMSELDAADGNIQAKAELQRLVRGLKRQRTLMQEQLTEAQREIARNGEQYYTEMYKRTPAHLPLVVLSEEIVGDRSSLKGYSAVFIW
jgi:hypothetical protein